ncbi:hypothetical protein AV530_017307 [Patagioenas fasciata monilis]|uniref:Uncharacterized protein n=1 Tax=Patagioenas fasciata monilis TaxID=372326 RepID=A0A1V4JFQ6_PATFA|nr:hypothetical protein AV530_017307 [Patagioenas fasciata monilis]
MACGTARLVLPAGPARARPGGLCAAPLSSGPDLGWESRKGARVGLGVVAFPARPGWAPQQDPRPSFYWTPRRAHL